MEETFCFFMVLHVYFPRQEIIVLGLHLSLEAVAPFFETFWKSMVDGLAGIITMYTIIKTFFFKPVKIVNEIM